MRIQLLGLLFIVFGLLSCQAQKQTIKQSSRTYSYYSDKLDFSLIGQWVENKRIVALGESSHGVGEFYSLKSELVKYLHQEKGFDVIAMEGGLGDINLAWMELDKLEAIQIRNNTLFSNFRCKEINPLFDYIKSQSKRKKPLIYAGFDVQTSGTYYENLLMEICEVLHLDIDVEETLSYYNKMYRAAFEPDSSQFLEYRNTFQNTLDQIRKAIQQNKEELVSKMELSETSFKILLKNLDQQIKSVDFSYANKMNEENVYQGIVLRDELMAENIEWILKDLYPNKKIILWGHNAHIQKGPMANLSTEWMGQLLKKTFGDDYFALALFAQKGNSYVHWKDESAPFDNSDPEFIESKMQPDQFQYNFQLFSVPNKGHWVHQKVKAFEVENMGVVEFIPSQRFDAAINLHKVNIPTYDK